MTEEFSITIEQVVYHLKRIYHPEIPLTYHVHFQGWHQHMVFRMRPDEQGRWRILPMPLPHYVLQAEEALDEAIRANEQGIQ